MDCTLQSENSREAYELAVYSYYHLANNKDKYLLIYSAFNWRLLTIAGFTVQYDLTEPAYKASAGKPNRYLINIAGGTGSGINQNKAYNRLLDEAAVRALNFFAECDLKQMFSSSATKEIEESLKGFTTDYLSVHFDKIYDSLSILNQ